MFSIVMPYYKNEKVVRRSIDSVVKQTVQDFELIIVDDGSHDGIDSIVNQYNNNKITVIHQENAGVSAARNKGIMSSKYDWICFLDSDDEWKKDHLETIANLQSKYPFAEVIITSHLRLGNQEVMSSECLPADYPTDFVTDDLLHMVFKYGEIIHTNSVCLKRELIQHVGMFTVSASIGEDTDMWFRCIMQAPTVFTRKVTTMYHRDASYLTSHNKFTMEWPFMERTDLLTKPEISIEKKISMKKICQRYQLTQCKHMLAMGKKQECKQKYTELKRAGLCSDVSRQIRQLDILLKIPTFICKPLCSWIYERKHKSY